MVMTDEEYLKNRRKRYAKLLSRHEGIKYTKALIEAGSFTLAEIRVEINRLHQKYANKE